MSAFGLYGRTREGGLGVARAGGPDRLSCVPGRRGPVHGVPNNRLGDSKGSVTAKRSSRIFLRVDGGFDSARQGLPGLFVD